MYFIQGYHALRYMRYQALRYMRYQVTVRQKTPAPLMDIINRRSGITSHTSHGHKTGTRSMQPVRSVPLGGPVVS